MGYPDLGIEQERQNLKTVFHFDNWFLRKVQKTFKNKWFSEISKSDMFLGLFLGTSYQNEKLFSNSVFSAQYTSLDTPQQYVLKTLIFCPYIGPNSNFKLNARDENVNEIVWNFETFISTPKWMGKHLQTFSFDKKRYFDSP